MKRLAFLILILQIFAVQLSAQVTNVEGRRVKTDSLGWYREFNTGFRLVKEVQKVFTLHGDARVQYKTEKDLYLVLGEYNWSRAKGQVNTHNSFLHLRYNRKLPLKRIRWEAFTQLQFNEITKINYRFLIGSGPRFKLLDQELGAIYLGSLYMFEFSQEKDIENQPLKLLEHRNSSYLSFSIFPKDNMSIISTTYYQPRLNKWTDYRVSAITEFRVKVSKLMTMGMSYRVYFDTFPAAGIPKVNHNFEQKIGIVF